MRARGFALAASAYFVFAAANAAEPGGWQMRTEANGDVCRAVLDGDSIDTQIMRNEDDKLVLVAGHPDWEMRTGPTALTLQVNDMAPADLNGIALAKSVFILVNNDAQGDAIKKATILKWHFPWGEFQSNVTGLGDAFDKLGKCS